MISHLKEHFLHGHTRHGVKVGLASVMAYVVSGWLGMPYAYWAVITTVIVMQTHVADSIEMCIYRFTGTALGAAIGTIAIFLFPETPGYTLLGIFLGTGTCAYFTRYNNRFRMAAITLSIVYLTSLGSDHRLTYAYMRLAEIGIGVFCAFLVSIAILPRRTGAELRERLQDQYDDLASRFTLLMGNFLLRQKDTDPDLFFDLSHEARKNRELFHKVFSMERRFYRDDVRLLSLQVRVLNSLIDRVQALPDVLNEVDGPGFDIILAPELNELTHAMADALHAIGSGHSIDRHRLAAAVQTLERRFIIIRKQGVTERFEARRLFQVLSFINSAQHLGEYVLEVLNREEIQDLPPAPEAE